MTEIVGIRELFSFLELRLPVQDQLQTMVQHSIKRIKTADTL